MIPKYIEVIANKRRAAGWKEEQVQQSIKMLVRLHEGQNQPKPDWYDEEKKDQISEERNTNNFRTTPFTRVHTSDTPSP